MTDHLEIEQKYDAEPDFVTPDLGGLPGCAASSEPATEDLDASYFDTADLRLAAHGITLRRRLGGGDEGWHLKLPVGQGVRRELHAPLGAGKRVPARLAALVSAYARGRRLRPVARLKTARTVVQLLDDGGAVLAVIADDAVSGQVLGLRGKDVTAADGDGQDAGRPTIDAWREIEVELDQGPQKLLKAAGKRIRKAGAKAAGSESKLARLLGERIPGSPVAGPEGTLDTVGKALTAYVAGQVRTVLEYDPRVRLAEYDSVHKMRVAIRRTRSILRTYRSVLDQERTGPLDAELRWLADALGEVRDLEVLQERFEGRLAELEQTEQAPGPAGPRDPVPGWLAALGAEVTAAHRRLVGELDGERYFALLDALEEFVADPPTTAAAGRRADKHLPRLIARACEKVVEALEEADRLETPGERDEARHRARRLAKRARYTAESAVPVLGREAREVVAAAESMQETLGGYQDGVIAQEYLSRTAATMLDSAGPVAREVFTLGLLIGLERCAAEHARNEIGPDWQVANTLRNPATG